MSSKLISNLVYGPYVDKIDYDENGKFQWTSNGEILRTQLESNDTPRFVEFDLSGLDISIVNGIRRIVLGEVESLAIHDVKMNTNKTRETDDNITIFNTEYIKDRLCFIPLHIDNEADLDEASNIIFTLCDPNDANKPIKNTNADNTNRKIHVSDLVMLRKIDEAEASEGAPVFKRLRTVVSHTPLEESSVGLNSPETSASASSSSIVSVSADAATNVATDLYVKIDDQETIDKWLKYPDMLLAEIKTGESLLVPIMPVLKGSPKGSNDAKWMSCICSYTFDVAKTVIENSIEDIQNYPKSGSSIGKTDWAKLTPKQKEAIIWGHFESPEKFNVVLEYNGHMHPLMAWRRAIEIFKDKLENLLMINRNFIDQLEENQYSYRYDDETSKVFLELIEETPGLLKFVITNEDHTLGNLVRTHFLYQLELLLADMAKSESNFMESLKNSMSQYKIPHPLDDKLELLLKADLIDLSNQVQYNMPNDALFSYRKTLAMLDYVLNDVIDRFLNPLLAETDGFQGKQVKQVAEMKHAIQIRESGKVKKAQQATTKVVQPKKYQPEPEPITEQGQQGIYDYVAPSEEEQEEEDTIVEELQDMRNEAEQYEQEERDDIEEEMSMEFENE